MISTASGGRGSAPGSMERSMWIQTGAGDFTVDRVRGDCTLVTGGRRCARRRSGRSVTLYHPAAATSRLRKCATRRCSETNGGNIVAGPCSLPVRAATGAGEVHIGKAGGTVHATTGGGQIIVDQAAGVVTAVNMAGSVQVGAAAGVHCESNCERRYPGHQYFWQHASFHFHRFHFRELDGQPPGGFFFGDRRW